LAATAGSPLRNGLVDLGENFRERFPQFFVVPSTGGVVKTLTPKQFANLTIGQSDD
jgi:hypothetical protein